MYILSVDTTAKTATVAVCEIKDNKVFPLCDAHLNSTLTHSESLLPMIDFCLSNSGKTVDDMDVLAITAGPGSFTGVRIGVSTVKGLAFGNDKVKCIAVSSLEALCTNVDDEKRGTVICALMDARRNQFYNAVFSANGKGKIKRLCSDRAIGIDDLWNELSTEYVSKNVVFVGDGAMLAYKLLSSKEGFSDMKISLVREDRLLQDAVSVARCASQHLDDVIPATQLNPVYLRLSQAERERNERLGINS